MSKRNKDLDEIEKIMIFEVGSSRLGVPYFHVNIIKERNWEKKDIGVSIPNRIEGSDVLILKNDRSSGERQSYQ